MSKRFVRQDSHRHFKLGRGRKKIQRWRRPRGRHSKMRKARKSYPASPTVGYRTERKQRGLIKGLKPLLVRNIRDLRSANGRAVIFASKLGAKKKIDLLKKAEEMKLKILNVKGDKK
ncbi:50S ribosomal protein L32e [Candidatus Pacearchaeota archaeon]|nr:50S ribosomal protein L32e [Candidatus Pacearchaeota archaeon]